MSAAGSTAARFPAVPGPEEAVLRTERLSMRFGGLSAVDDVTFEIKRGEVRAIIGPNGAGKSTLFNCLTGVLRPSAGRILFNGVPTGVEVCHAMVHGGPFPATSDSRTTSVGTAAILRFARPVCYQDFDPALLPPELQDGNPRKIWRMVDGQITKD